MTYYKATRPDGTDFQTGTIDYAAASEDMTTAYLVGVEHGKDRALAGLREAVEGLPGVPCHRWHEHTDANGGEEHAAVGSGAISRVAVLALLDKETVK